MELFAKAHQAEASRRTDVMLALSTTQKETVWVETTASFIGKTRKMTYTSHIFPTSTRFEHKPIQVSQALNCLEDSTMRNRRHTRRRRGCPRIANNNYIPSLEGCT